MLTTACPDGAACPGCATALGLNTKQRKETVMTNAEKKKWQETCAKAKGIERMHSALDRAMGVTKHAQKESERTPDGRLVMRHVRRSA